MMSSTMMKRFLLAIVFFLSVLIGLVALAQENNEQSFTVVQQFGRLRPQGIQYDPNFDRFAWVNEAGSLVLVDATTFTEQTTLYEQGAYNSYQFSNNGRYLALAIDRRIELWDTQTGAMLAMYEPEGALSVTGPLRFSDDDSYLLLDSVVPAPAATRRSENDTDIIPWLWDLLKAQDIAPSRLRNRDDALPFFNFRNGLLLGPQDSFIAAVPERLQIINGRDAQQPVVNEIFSGRAEVDPISVWRSASDDFMYVRPINSNNLVQVNTDDGTTFEIPLGRELTYGSIEQMEGLHLSNLARIIGEPATLNENSLLRLIYGPDYRSYYNYQPMTVMLLDMIEPMTAEAGQSALLMYTFVEGRSTGVLELIRPIGITKMALHPDKTHLMVRRGDFNQPIEIYNLNTGVLEKTIFPATVDFDGFHTFGYNGTGDVIINDFQRFDAETGDILLEDPHFAIAYDRYYFSEDSQNIVLMRAGQWQVWDIASGEPIRTERHSLEGDVIATWPDGQRFLTQRFTDNGGAVVEIVNIGTGQTRSLTLPFVPDHAIQQIIPSANWEDYLVVYSSDIAVYNMDRGQLFYMDSINLPDASAREYGWLDDRTIYVRSNAFNPAASLPIYGVDYHPSGLPMCMVEAYPDDWETLLPLWEQFNWNFSGERLNRLSVFLCGNLTDTVESLPLVLTPTPEYQYQADATRVPIDIVGVPTCLTANFQREALAYAEAWRAMTEGLSEEQTAELETLLCEGLITSISGLQPTPTVNPNTLNATTPTPLPQGPSSEDTAQRQNIAVMTIDIETQIRQVGTYFPPQASTSRNIDLILGDFQQQFGYYPQGAQLSPDGRYLATIENNGFIVVWVLSRPYEIIAADVTATREAERAEQVRAIGLRPTATQDFAYVGEPFPTVTPTLAPTLLPFPMETAVYENRDVIEDLCPARSLYDLDNLPPEYAATGRLIVLPLDNLPIFWVLEPENGRVYPDETFAGCSGNCSLSFDGSWALRVDQEIAVSRVDGSERIVLFTAEERPVWPGTVNWVGEHTLEYFYTAYIPERGPGQYTLIRRFDPTTGELTEPFDPVPNVTINNLPTDVVAMQPDAQRLAVLNTPYNTANGTGFKYYMYDYETETAALFATSGPEPLRFSWHPLGEELYYVDPLTGTWYIFDPETREHRVFGDFFPGQLWSRDGRYRVDWTYPGTAEQIETVLAGELPYKISIWDRETGLTRRYCIPESGLYAYGESLVWSPDNRYLVFQMQLPLAGDDELTRYREEVELAMAQGRTAAENFGVPEALLPTAFPTVSRFAETFPTPLPTMVLPTTTPIPMETEYQLRRPRTVVLDTLTGSVTVLSEEVDTVTYWVED